MKDTMKSIIWVIILTITIVSCSSDGTDPPPPPTESKTENFMISSNGTSYEGKIYLPAAYVDGNKNLPTIYLIDFTEQHYPLVTDEFEKVKRGTAMIEGLDALIISFNQPLDIDAQPNDFQKYYDIFKDMASYIDSKYTNNTSRTFIGKGSEAGIVLMALFLEETETSLFQNFIATDPPNSFMDPVKYLIQYGNFPQDKLSKKLHFSFSFNESYRDSHIEFIIIITDQQYP